MLRHTLNIFRAKFKFFSSKVDELDELFEASFSSVAESGRPLSRSVVGVYSNVFLKISKGVLITFGGDYASTKTVACRNLFEYYGGCVTHAIATKPIQ